MFASFSLQIKSELGHITAFNKKYFIRVFVFLFCFKKAFYQRKHKQFRCKTKPKIISSVIASINNIYFTRETKVSHCSDVCKKMKLFNVKSTFFFFLSFWLKNPCAVGSCDTFLLVRKSSGLAKVLEKLVERLKSTAARKLITGCFLCFVFCKSGKPVIAPWSLKSGEKVKVGEEGSHGRKGRRGNLSSDEHASAVAWRETAKILQRDVFGLHSPSLS